MLNLGDDSRCIINRFIKLLFVVFIVDYTLVGIFQFLNKLVRTFFVEFESSSKNKFGNNFFNLFKESFLTVSRMPRIANSSSVGTRFLARDSDIGPS